MDIWGLTAAALRRWYVLVPMLAISVAAAYLLGSRAQAEYEVNGSVMLVVPPQRNPNPYSDDYATEILGIQATSSSTREDFVNRGLTDKYVVEFERRSPIMTLQVVASDELMALETAEAIIDYLDDTLIGAQKDRGVANAQQVTLAVVDAPDAAEPVVGGRMRVTAVVVGLGALLSLACAVFVDAILLRRRDRATAAASASPQTGSEPDVVAFAGRKAQPTPSES